MSDPFVGPVPMRWEFDTLLNNLTVAATEYTDAYEIARAEVCRAFDAQAARIAELDRQLESVRHMLGNACEILGGEQCAVDGRLAFRARIAREFYDEVRDVHLNGRPSLPQYEVVDNVLARWEAAAKEGE